MWRRAELLVRRARARFVGGSSSSSRSSSSGGAAPPFTSLDRLLRFKPALTHTEKNSDGEPEDAAADEFGGDGDGSGGDEEGGYGGRDPRFILGRRLLRLGKVNYRHIEGMPEWLQEVQRGICSNRTVPQIRRCLEKWMIKSDRELQERYRDRRLVWRRDANSDKAQTLVTYGPEETVAYAHYFLPARYALAKRILSETKTLLPGFRPRRVLDFGCGPATVGAALAEVWGGGAGGGGCAKYTGVDISRSMLDAAKGVMQAVREAHGTDSVFWDKSGEVVRRAETKGERYDLVVASFVLSELPSDAARSAATQLLFELVDVGGLLLVLEPGNPQGSHTVRTARQLVLDSFNHPAGVNEAAGGGGSGDGKKWTRKRAEAKMERDGDASVLKKPTRAAPVLPAPRGLTHAEVGAFTVSPCTHDLPCPLARGAWCSFSQRVHSGMIRQAAEEKFSYVVLQKRALDELNFPSSSSMRGRSAVWSGRAARNGGGDDRPDDLWIQPKGPGSGAALTDASRDPTPLHVLERFMEADEEALPALVDAMVDQVDWEEYNPPLYRAEWGRVLRSPLKNTGHVTLDLCLPSGDIARNVLSKSNVVHVPSLYTALRKTTWGGLFPVLQGDRVRSPLAVEHKGVAPSSFLSAATPHPTKAQAQAQAARNGNELAATGRRPPRVPTATGADNDDGAFASSLWSRTKRPGADTGVRAAAAAASPRNRAATAAAAAAAAAADVPEKPRGRIRPAVARRPSPRKDVS